MTDRYQLRGTEVQAFKVDFAANSPKWLTDAINSGVIYYQGGVHPYYTIDENGYVERANAGDYITKSDSGHRVVRRDFFERYYVKLDVIA